MGSVKLGGEIEDDKIHVRTMDPTPGSLTTLVW
jgi:hypothetical protein